MTRPCRSEFRATSISSMISGSVVALVGRCESELRTIWEEEVKPTAV